MVDAPDQRRIAVFTGSRAEYGLMRHLIAGIAAEPSLRLQLIVSGSHLSANHGGTLTEIEADGHWQQPSCRCLSIRSHIRWRR